MQLLEEKITAWRQEIARAESIGTEALRELESHLRDAIDAELERGATLVEAFDGAIAQVGSADQLETEYRKVYPDYSWAKRIIWMLSGYALVSLALKATWIAQEVTEEIGARWFPNVPIALPEPIQFEGPSIYRPEEGIHRLDHVQLYVLAGILAMLAATALAICFGARCIRGKMPWFDRLFAPCSALRSLVFIFISFGIIIFANLPTSWRLDRWNSVEDFGLSLQFFGSWGDLAKLTMLIAFSFWALTQLKKIRERRFVIWMFAGFFVVVGLVRLAGLTGGLMGTLVYAISPEFASANVMSRLPGFFYYSRGTFAAFVCQVGLCLGLAFFAFRIAFSGRAPKSERVVHWLWNHALFLMIIWYLPQAWGKVVTLISLRRPMYSIEPDDPMVVLEGMSLAFANSYSIAPLFAIVLAVAAGWVLFREQRGRTGGEELLSE